MITITLIQRGLGVPFGVEQHSSYMDYELRDDPKTTTSSTVDIAEENPIAPLVARLGSVPANESYAQLNKAHERLLAKYKDREDGLRVITMLISWAIRWPQGIWEISGRHLDVIGARGDFAGIDPEASNAPRYSSDSVTTTNTSAKLVGMFDRQGDQVESLIVHPRDRELTTEELMRPEYTFVRTGGGGAGRVKKDKKRGSNSAAAVLLDDGLRPMMASGRVSIEAHTALYSLKDEAGHKIAPGQLLEIVGLAIASGRTYDDVVKALTAQERTQ